jgi:hypothetical protein
MKRKWKKGVPEPLVFSGRLKQMALGPMGLRPAPSAVTIELQVPDYLYKRPSTSQIDKNKELTAINLQEVQKLADIIGESIASDLESEKETRTVVIE